MKFLFQTNKSTQDWSYTDDAIDSVVRDFTINPRARLLLVIPTGGGKTITAIRTINSMIVKGLIRKGEKVIWTVHSKQIKAQTITELESEDNRKKFGFCTDLYAVLEIRMKEDAKKALLNDGGRIYKWLVIDEAHHSAASSYAELFQYDIGILGLTATPTRTDQAKLDFKHVSYTITFRELVKRGVVIEPEFQKRRTNRFINVSKIDGPPFDPDAGQKFNLPERNKFIANVILKSKFGYKKIVVFVGSNQHVDDLYSVIAEENSRYNLGYHVGFIYSDNRNGKTNDLGKSNDDYLKWHKAVNRSILVNCAMLNEGYNDPSIDTVVMAVPTRSILYYMQCIGRAVRHPGDKPAKAYVVEIADDLPNAVYRIDNKWLYQDLSDRLEPTVIDKAFWTKGDHDFFIRTVINKYNLDPEQFKNCLMSKEFSSTSLLLLKPTSSVANYVPLYFGGSTKELHIGIFNEVSNNIEDYGSHQNTASVFFNRLNVSKTESPFKDEHYRMDFMSALRLAYNEIINQKREEDRLQYYVFQKKRIRNICDFFMYIWSVIICQIRRFEPV